MSDLTALTAEVARDTSINTSAVTLINGLAAQIAALKTPAAIALAASVKASATQLATALVENTRG